MTTKQIQRLLAHFKYDVTIDGIPGPQTSAAVQTFQEEYGVTPVDGDAGPVTDDALIEAVCDGWKRPTNSQPQAKPDVPDTNAGDTGTFWDGIPNFKRIEFGCQCGGRYCNGFPAEPKETMVRIAQAARDHFGRPATVVSGVRCKQHNTNVGGVWNSQHQDGEACDLRVGGISADELLAFLLGQPGVRYAEKINSTNVHFDVPQGSK